MLFRKVRSVWDQKTVTTIVTLTSVTVTDVDCTVIIGYCDYYHVTKSAKIGCCD